MPPVVVVDVVVVVIVVVLVVVFPSYAILPPKNKINKNAANQIHIG